MICLHFPVTFIQVCVAHLIFLPLQRQHECIFFVIAAALTEEVLSVADRTAVTQQEAPQTVDTSCLALSFHFNII